MKQVKPNKNKHVGTENRVMDTRGEAWGVGGKGRQNG